jgi:small subunit ribosomal protein S20
MAHHKSAQKRIKRNQARAEVNGGRRNRIRSFIRKVETAIASGDASAAREALKAAEPEIMRGVSRGILAKSTGARKVSRLSARIRSLTS